MNLLTNWFRRHFSDPQVVILVVMLIIGSVVVLFFGRMLGPVLASVVIAYLLQGPVGALERRRVPRLVAVPLVFLTFVVFFLFLLLGVFPVIWQQMEQLFQQLPNMIAWSKETLLRLPERYPDFFSEQQVNAVIGVLRNELTSLGQRILSLSLASVRVLIWILVYTFLMPLLVFFFLKDKERIVRWLTSFMPDDRSLASEVWQEVDQQIGNYVRGKFWEILIVWSVSFVTFTILGLEFAMLISLFVGLSVLIPYIGAVAMAIPVALIAYFQWRWSSQFGYAVAAYVVIQILDGNVLVTLLFSEAVNIHPIAIIVAILVFGGTFGFWGVFFAIPLATLVHAILRAWFSRTGRGEEEQGKKRESSDEKIGTASDSDVGSHLNAPPEVPVGEQK
jgi:putative permease